MKREAFAVAFLVLSTAGALLVGSVMGDGGIVYFPSVPQIIINADGAITPQTDQISRSGSTYTLTEDLNGTQVVIECSNIIFDGNDHSISLLNSGSNPAIHISNSINTSIKNVELFTPLYTGIAMYGCSSCHITGVKTSGHIELRVSSYNVISENSGPLFLKSEHNQVYRNNITGLALWAGSNVFYENNVLLDVFDQPLYLAAGNVWDNGSVGNYWSDYLTRYPNASEVGDTGVGDTPYVIDEYNVDYHPLMNPYDIEDGVLATSEPEFFAAALIVGASGVSVTAVCVGLLTYFKKRRR